MQSSSRKKINLSDTLLIHNTVKQVKQVIRRKIQFCQKSERMDSCLDNLTNLIESQKSKKKKKNSLEKDKHMKSEKNISKMMKQIQHKQKVEPNDNRFGYYERKRLVQELEYQKNDKAKLQYQYEMLLRQHKKLQSHHNEQKKKKDKSNTQYKKLLVEQQYNKKEASKLLKVLQLQKKQKDQVKQYEFFRKNLRLQQKWKDQANQELQGLQEFKIQRNNKNMQNHYNEQFERMKIYYKEQMDEIKYDSQQKYKRDIKTLRYQFDEEKNQLLQNINQLRRINQQTKNRKYGKALEAINQLNKDKQSTEQRYKFELEKMKQEMKNQSAKKIQKCKAWLHEFTKLFQDEERVILILM